MKRILAIVLVLMLAVSLMPASALADDGIFVSVGGRDFTKLDQTIYGGGGKATLTWPGSNPQLKLENMNLTSFYKLGSADDGTGLYAGIVYAGNYRLEINCVNCTITVPSHNSKSAYDGIYAEGNINLTGSLTIKNADAGIETYGLYTNGATLKISSAIGPAVIGNSIEFHSSNCTFDSNAEYVIIADTLKSDGNLTINHRPDASKSGGDIVSIATVSKVSLSTTTNINLTADLSAYKGSEMQQCAAVACDGTFEQRGPININVSVKGNPNAIVEGIDANNLCFYTNGKTTVHLNLSGSHLLAYCMAGNYLNRDNSVHNYPLIECIIKGAAADDIAFIVTEKPTGYDSSYFLFGEVYCSVDNADAMAMLFHKDYSYVAGYCNGNYTEPLNMNYPAGGKYVDLTMYDESVYRTVADSEGNPATSVFLSNKAYSFRDIDTSSVAPYKAAILWAVDNGITTGFSPVEFRPNADCTRGQVVTFLWRAKGCPEPAITENPFVDVSETSPFYKAILWAFESGITTGFDETHFKPSNPCTRAQVVTFLWRADGKPAPQSDDNPFKDVSSTGNTKPYYEAILWAAESGITSGYSDGTFRPNVTCSRGQIVTFIYRDLHEKQVKQRGEIVDVSIVPNPESTASKLISIANNPYENNQQMRYFGTRWTYVPVDVTATFADGSSETRTMNVPLYNENGDFTVPEGLLELLCRNGNTLYLTCFGGTNKFIVVLDFDNAKAHFVSSGMYAESAPVFTVNGNYIIYGNSKTSYCCVYSMKDDVIKHVAITKNYSTSMKDMVMVGDMIYVSNEYHPTSLWASCTYTVYGISFAELESKNMNVIGRYERVASFAFDETGYTVEFFGETADDETTFMHYDFPA